uniref:Uncharacterized protein n=2 Tax=Ciona intestinalis TaxID=7719 RepID=F6V3S8_CIOIN
MDAQKMQDENEEQNDEDSVPSRSLSLPVLVEAGSKVIDEGEGSNSLGSSSRSCEADAKSETGVEDATIVSSVKTAMRTYRNKPRIKRFMNMLSTSNTTNQ